MFPFTGGVWDVGMSLRHGGLMMLREINSNPSLLPGYELKVVWQDDLCDAGVGLTRLLENIFDKRFTAFAPGIPEAELDSDRNGVIETADVEPFQQVWNSTEVSPDIVGFVGACCSAVALDVNNIAYKARIPFISPAATRPILSDRSLFPNFFRSQMPDTAHSNPWVAIARLLGQRSIVCVIAEATDWHSGGTDLAKAAAAQGVELAGPDLGFEIPGFHGLEITLDSATAARGIASELLMLKRRIVIFLTYAPRARLVMCEAYRLGFLNAVYMPIGWLEPGWWAKTDTACTVDQLTRMATGQIVVSIVAFRTDADTRLSCSSSMTSGEFRSELYSRQVNASRHGYTPVVEPAFVADSLCMYALALHEVLLNQSVPVAELSARTPRAYTAVQDALSHSNFEGVSGRMIYEPGSSDPKASVIVRQVQAGGTVDVATYAHPHFNFLGKANLTFQFPDENWFAGPAGAKTISAHLTPYVTCPKGKLPNLHSNMCEDCPERTEYVPAAKTCLCVEGFFAAADGGCLPCQGGTFSNTAGALECSLCEAGKYAALGATSCSLCPRGTIGETAGLSACKQCPSLHTTQEIGAVAEAQCVCDKGSYQNRSTADGISCKACPSEATTSGIDSLDIAECRCRKGMFMTASGSCTACPPGSTTEEDGKTSVVSCLCTEGTYMPLGAVACRPCPASMSCPKGSSQANFALADLVQRTAEQQFPLLLPRYWSSVEEPMSIFDCRDEKKCPGGAPGRACAPKTDGSVACQHCSRGYQWDGNRCASCEALTLLGYIGASFFLAAAPVCVIILYKLSGDAPHLWGSRGSAIKGLLFVTLNHYQLLALVLGSANIPLSYRSTTGATSWTIRPLRIFQPACIGMADLTLQMVVKAHIPVFILLTCLCTYALSVVAASVFSRPQLQMQWGRLLSIVGSVCFTFFGAIATASMALFDCSENPNGLSTLTWDLSITCFNSSEWRRVLGIAIFSVVVYVIGLGALFIRAIWIAPAHFQDPSFQARWKFLFVRFHSGAYWWGIIYLVKNTLIQLTFVVFTSTWSSQSIALAGFTIYAGMAMCYMPYRTMVVNVVEIVSSSCVSYATALLFFFAEKAGDHENEIMATFVGVSSIPCGLMFCGAAYSACFGKRSTPTAAQLRRAEKAFEDLVRCSMTIVALDSEDGKDFLLSIGELEHRAIMQYTNILHSDLLGIKSKGRISHTKTSERVRASVMQSTRSAWSRKVDGSVRKLSTQEDEDAATGSDGETFSPLPSECDVGVEPPQLTGGASCIKVEK